MATGYDGLIRYVKSTANASHRPAPHALRHRRMFAALAATAKEVPLTGPQIRVAISGKYVTDEYHWGHKYFADGRVERSENGRQRSARWSIKGNQLCLLQQEISKDQPICYSVIRAGQELQYKDDAQFVVFRGLVGPCPSANRGRLRNSLQMRLEPQPRCGAHDQPHYHDEHCPKPALGPGAMPGQVSESTGTG